MAVYKVRQFTRFRTKVNVMLRSVGRFSWSRAQMLNLSQGGLMLESDEAFPLGAEVEIEFNTVGADGKTTRRRLRGQILWRRGSRHGLKFVTSRAASGKNKKS